jgi:hypothetical protein
MSVAYDKAVELLHAASTPAGFVAAVREEDNYRRVWTRDSALCGLAALTTGDSPLIDTFRRSIETVFGQVHRHGFIPSNVSPGNDLVSYGSAVGRVDNHAWIIISACNYAHVMNKREWLLPFRPLIDGSLALMNAWEFNGRGLMYVPQSADWADEYHHHGYILYNQLLRLWALRCAVASFPEDWGGEARRVEDAIVRYFTGDEAYSAQVARMRTGEETGYWTMGFNTSRVYTQFDLAANALALLLGVGTNVKRHATVQYITDILGVYMLPSFYPVIRPGDGLMREMENNYAFRFRNAPHEFHNGGLWSVWNGLLAHSVGSLDVTLNQRLISRIASACAQNDWDFNECHHGETGKGIGVPQCAWSAAGLILAVNHSFQTQFLR